MKHIVRSFSVGLIAAGLVTLLVFYTFGDSTSDEVTYSTEEMITLIEEDGYRVVTADEYISYTVTNAQKDKDAANTEEESGEETEAKNENQDEETSNEEADAKEETEEVVEEEEVEEVEEETVEEETVTTVSINIPSGMASLDVSRLLENENVVDDAEEFNEYLLQNGYSQRVQLGSHELTTDMSFFEVAEALSN